MPDRSAHRLEILLRSEQEATDPYLCAWAEFHFLATLAHYDEHPDKAPDIIIGYTTLEDGTECITYCIGKGSLDDVHFDVEPHRRSVKTGPSTYIGLAGEYEDMILIPLGDNRLTVGRKVLDRYLNEVGLLATSSLKLSQDIYIQAKYNTIKRALDRHGVSNMADLYKILKSRMISNYESDPLAT